MIALPSRGQLFDIVLQQTGVGYVLGMASPHFGSQIVFGGSLVDYDSNPMPFSGDTPFEIASISKVFTAALLTLYAQSNSDLLSMSVTSCPPHHLPPLPSSYDVITLLNLANYTSGLPEDDSDLTADTPTLLPQPYTSLNMYSYLHDDNVPPSGTGTTYTYSNMAPALLANAIPTAIGSDLSFSELLARDVTGPLKMSGTRPYVEVPFTKIPQAFTNGSAVSGGWNQLPAFLGGSGLVSTANDMLAWLKLSMGMMPESPLHAIVKPMQTPSTTVLSTSANDQLGIGWFLNTLAGTVGDGKLFSLPIVYKPGEITGCSCICFNQSSDPGVTPSEAGMFLLTNNTLSADALPLLSFTVLLALNAIWNPTNLTLGGNLL